MDDLLKIVIGITLIAFVVIGFEAYHNYQINSPLYAAGDCASSPAVEDWDQPDCFRVMQVGKSNYRVTTCAAYTAETTRYGISISMVNVPFSSFNKTVSKVECP
jgi:hypothetical protein